ncbi:MAG: hypothetical protein Q4B26_02095 [Eubacteriales bacterium]|nr:hypothetical protein [Eubacteriales bacterium]
MPKVYKANHAGETFCKELHTKLNMKTGPTRLVQPNFYLIVDVDELQKQVNSLENGFHRLIRTDAGKRWRNAGRTGSRRT